jgi:hypothetical protein
VAGLDFHSRKGGPAVHTLRKYLCWIFGFSSLVCLQLAISSLLSLHHRRHGSFLLLNLLVPTLFTAQAAVFGVAWWTVWRGKPSARGWGITASVINVLLPLPIIYLSRSLRGIWLILAIGVAGLVAFWRRYEEPDSSPTTHENLGIPGDGTNSLVNKTAGGLIFAAAYGVYYWWSSWLRSRAISVGEGTWDRTVMLVLVLLAITTLHELGHAATGLALGMKLRAFLVGPFQWRIRDGKWEFRFNLMGILSLRELRAWYPLRPIFPGEISCAWWRPVH